MSSSLGVCGECGHFNRICLIDATDISAICVDKHGRSECLVIATTQVWSLVSVHTN